MNLSKGYVGFPCSVPCWNFSVSLNIIKDTKVYSWVGVKILPCRIAFKPKCLVMPSNYRIVQIPE